MLNLPCQGLVSFLEFETYIVNYDEPPASVFLCNQARAAPVVGAAKCRLRQPVPSQFVMAQKVTRRDLYALHDTSLRNDLFHFRQA